MDEFRNNSGTKEKINVINNYIQVNSSDFMTL